MTTQNDTFVNKLVRSHHAILRVIRDPLQRLALRTRLSAKLSIRGNSATITLLCVSPPAPMFVAGSQGARFHLAFGSSGACLLAALTDARIHRILQRAPQTVWNLQTPAEVWERIAEVRACGYCVDPGQFHPNVHGISTPLRDPSGQITAAVTLMGFAHDLNGSTIDKHAKSLLQTAHKIHLPAAKH